MDTGNALTAGTTARRRLRSHFATQHIAIGLWLLLGLLGSFVGYSHWIHVPESSNRQSEPQNPKVFVALSGNS
jgi:hypothetical protein